MEEWFVSALAKFTPGAAGIWVLVVMAAVAWWKGLPGVLDAWTNRLTTEKEHREKEIERLERQIAAADDRHEECLAGQKLLRTEIAEMQKSHAAETSRLHSDIAKLHADMSAMVIKMRQMQLSAGRVVPNMPDEYSAMIEGMERGRES